MIPLIRLLHKYITKISLFVLKNRLCLIFKVYETNICLVIYSHKIIYWIYKRLIMSKFDSLSYSYPHPWAQFLAYWPNIESWRGNLYGIMSLWFPKYLMRIVSLRLKINWRLPFLKYYFSKLKPLNRVVNCTPMSRRLKIYLWYLNTKWVLPEHQLEEA